MDHARPFDARLQLLTDKPSAAPAWSTVSLVTALREYMLREPTSVFPPCDEHAALLAECADELTKRGMDAHCLIRYGLLSEIFGGLIGATIQQWLDPEESQDPAVVKAQAWLNVLEPRFAGAGLTLASLRENRKGALAGLVSVMVNDLTGWLLSAPLEDLLSLEPPSEEALEATPPPQDIDQELLDAYRWAVDRFSVTSLHDWTTPSLHLELKWLCNSAPPPCSPTLMSEQTIDRATLEAEVARRAVFPQAQPQYRQIRASLASRMTRQAMTHLRDLHFEEAAALFEFAVAEDPTDAEALNNLGFCRMPTDPRAAREHLQRSADLGYRLPAVNLHNRVVTTYLLSGANAALQLAEGEWAQLGQARAVAMLWDVASDGRTLTLTEAVEAKEQLATFAARLASMHDLADVARTWESRLTA